LERSPAVSRHHWKLQNSAHRSAFLFSWTPIGRAITQRLKGQNAPNSEKLDEILDSVFELQGMMERVGADMEDMQDRLSFAERLLTAGAGKEKELTPA